MTDHIESPEEETTNESRRNFLKQAGVAGLTAGGASVAGVAALGMATAEEANAAEIACEPGDKVRSVIGGAPIHDDPLAFGKTTVLAPLEDRVLALKQLMIDKGLLQEQFIKDYVEYYNEQVGPYIGKAVVAHAWVDESFRDALLNPAKPKYRPYRNHANRGPFAAALYIQEYLNEAAKNNQLGFIWPPPQGLRGTLIGPEGTYVRVVANGKQGQKRVHNLVVCTLCSCYPQALLGVQPVYYKSMQYRARSISAPRGVIQEFAESFGNLSEVNAYLDNIDVINVWDSNSEVRFFVLPEPPAGADLSPGNELNLAKLVSRNGMIGTQIL